MAWKLADHGSVLVLEAEAQPGYHSTGRSAALMTVNYGPELVRRINVFGQQFMLHKDDDFCEYELLTQAGFLSVAGVGDEAHLEKYLNDNFPSDVQRAEVQLLNERETLEIAPLLRHDTVGASVYEPGVTGIDVGELHQGYLRALVKHGASVECGQRVERLVQTDGFWRLSTRTEEYQCRTVVNAAGAWAGQIGKLAGAAELALVPKRRTAIVVDAGVMKTSVATSAVEFITEEPYLKPQSGQLMASLGEAVAVPPQDIQADEIDVATLVDWLERKTTLEISRVSHQWAGLRSFVADDCPVVGFDTRLDNFFWLAGQGGFGIMMSEPLARAATSLITSNTLPEDFVDAGIDESALAVSRLQ